MNPRINLVTVNPKAMQSMVALQTYVDGSGLESKLLHLVKLRASQINGCAYCIDMHTKEARAAGESEQRLYALSAWSETPFYTARERAALAWTEAVTLVTEGHVPDHAFAAVREHFSEEELVNLTLAITTTNAWNRLSVAFRAVPGSYVRQLSSVSVSSSRSSPASN
jgi:AhpD family alkylhydroperoxidase